MLIDLNSPKFKLHDTVISPEGIEYNIIGILYDTEIDKFVYRCSNYSNYKICIREDIIKLKEDITMIPHYDWQIKLKEDKKLMTNTHTPYQKEVVELSKQLIATIHNMNTTCGKAGGSGFGIPDLEKMTALDLLCTFASNNIRFEYVKE